jgi:putative protease
MIEPTPQTASSNPPQAAEPRPLPELLAPAGDWDCARAAVENGADAIYFGLDRFNARMRAENFTEADLPKLMEFLHRRGAKGYVTLNTLVFQNELADAEHYLRSMIAAGVDAVIVQDIGVCRLIRDLSPDFPIHASTQMTISSPKGIAFAGELGCHLVVLARECALREIEQMQPARVPLEVFVHGALCVAYSGQCLTSEALGGRSANRGECAQACRMPYELVADGKPVPLGDRRYLLSPQDLAGLEVLGQLIRIGVASLKIEGRLKSPEYVANITSVYRQALDRLAGAAPPKEESPDKSHPDQTEEKVLLDPLVASSRYQVEMAFSRGLSTGWFEGINNQKLVHARFGKKRGVYLGQVTGVSRELVRVHLQGPLKPGDGVVFDSGHPEDEEQGGRVYTLEKQGDESLLGFGRGDVDFARVHPGDRIWKTSDPELERRLRQTFSGPQPRFQRPVDLELHGRADIPLTVIVRDELGHVVQFTSAMNLVRANAQPLTTERLREQLGRLGGTSFRLGQLQNHLEGDVILPIRELNRLRRECVAELDRLRSQPCRWTLHDGGLRSLGVSADTRSVPATTPAECLTESDSEGASELIALVRNRAQLEAALESGVQTVYCDFEDPKKYREAVQRFRAWQAESPQERSNAAIFVAPPRIFKTGEDWVLKQVASSNADGYLVRNYDHLEFFAGHRRVGDYSLNIANSLTADYFKTKFGLERVTASYDLNNLQLEALLAAAPPAWFEITLHQHMPMFHMEHCVFCAFLSSGTDYTNCGRPCDRHELLLKDRVGALHPVKADAGCRNTVFNARAQTGAEFVSRLLRLGVRHFRIEFVSETEEAVKQTLRQYERLLSGQMSGAELWRELKLLNQLGVTRGNA